MTCNLIRQRKAQAFEFPADLSFALALADLADSVSLPRFRSTNLSIEVKQDRSFVTDADKAVEHALRARIETERPENSFFGEESGRTEKGRRRWLIDPIDGTSNFLRGVPNWSMIALVESPQVCSLKFLTCEQRSV